MRSCLSSAFFSTLFKVSTDSKNEQKVIMSHTLKSAEQKACVKIIDDKNILLFKQNSLVSGELSLINKLTNKALKVIKIPLNTPTEISKILIEVLDNDKVVFSYSTDAASFILICDIDQQTILATKKLNCILQVLLEEQKILVFYGSAIEYYQFKNNELILSSKPISFLAHQIQKRPGGGYIAKNSPFGIAIYNNEYIRQDFFELADSISDFIVLSKDIICLNCNDEKFILYDIKNKITLDSVRNRGLIVYMQPWLLENIFISASWVTKNRQKQLYEAELSIWQVSENNQLIKTVCSIQPTPPNFEIDQTFSFLIGLLPLEIPKIQIDLGLDGTLALVYANKVKLLQFEYLDSLLKNSRAIHRLLKNDVLPLTLNQPAGVRDITLSYLGFK